MATCRRKQSQLCVSIDPALPQQRKHHTLPHHYLLREDENAQRLAFCLDIIDRVQPYTAVIKLNQHYLFGFTKRDHHTLTQAIKDNAMLSLLDLKVNDIRDSMQFAFYARAFC